MKKILVAATLAGALFATTLASAQTPTRPQGAPKPEPKKETAPGKPATLTNKQTATPTPPKDAKGGAAHTNKPKPAPKATKGKSIDEAKK